MTLLPPLSLGITFAFSLAPLSPFLRTYPPVSANYLGVWALRVGDRRLQVTFRRHMVRWRVPIWHRWPWPMTYVSLTSDHGMRSPHRHWRRPALKSETSSPLLQSHCPQGLSRSNGSPTSSRGCI